MKKLLLAITLLLTMTSQSQIIEKGDVIRIEKCRFADEGGYRIISSKPAYKTFASITRTKFTLRTMESTRIFELGDEQVSVIEGDSIYNYYTMIRKNLMLLGVRRCEEAITVAIFSMDGDQDFVQYIIKPRKSGRHTGK